MKGKKIFTFGFDQNSDSNLKQWIRLSGGELLIENVANVIYVESADCIEYVGSCAKNVDVVDYIVDYAIVPINFSTTLMMKAKEIVTHLWLEGLSFLF